MTTRRQFLKAVGGVTLLTIVPRNVLGRGMIAPSDELTKGIIGVGGMGRNHIPYDGTRVVAMCDVDKNHLNEAAGLVKDKIALYHDFRDLILDKNVDIVLLPRHPIGMALWQSKQPMQGKTFSAKTHDPYYWRRETRDGSRETAW